MRPSGILTQSPILIKAATETPFRTIPEGQVNLMQSGEQANDPRIGLSPFFILRDEFQIVLGRLLGPFNHRHVAAILQNNDP